MGSWVIILLEMLWGLVFMTDIALNNSFSQFALRKIAYASSSTLGNDLYFLKEFVDMMVNVIGEDAVIELLKKNNSGNKTNLNRIGKEWNEQTGMKRKLIKLDKIIEKTKASYDLLDDKTLKKKDVKYENFKEKAKKISVIKPDLFALFVFLVNSTSISRMTIPQEYFKHLEHRQSRSVGDLDKRRVGDPVRPRSP